MFLENEINMVMMDYRLTMREIADSIHISTEKGIQYFTRKIEYEEIIHKMVTAFTD